MSASGARDARVESFPSATAAALADAQHRANVRHAQDGIRARRAGVVAEVSGWEALRDEGAAIKDRALLRLDAVLEELEHSVTARGGVVHWARDALEANEIVTGLVRDTGVDEVVKVKSLTTDEIGLNEALARAGVRAIETDLAELIIQLAGERPSHLLVPAIHKNRTEIRDLFRARFGRPELTDEPSDLAEAARIYLREAFLRAQVAISGANFAVAETGTVCVVESEGNGRMCTTLRGRVTTCRRSPRTRRRTRSPFPPPRNWRRTRHLRPAGTPLGRVECVRELGRLVRELGPPKPDRGSPCGSCGSRARGDVTAARPRAE